VQTTRCVGDLDLSIFENRLHGLETRATAAQFKSAKRLFAFFASFA